jgi:hypothetical protein
VTEVPKSRLGNFLKTVAEHGMCPLILALGRLKQEDHEFKANLGYLVSSSLDYKARLLKNKTN